MSVCDLEKVSPQLTSHSPQPLNVSENEHEASGNDNRASESDMPSDEEVAEEHVGSLPGECSDGQQDAARASVIEVVYGDFLVVNMPTAGGSTRKRAQKFKIFLVELVDKKKLSDVS